MASNEALDHFLDLLSPLGGVSARPMFGGHGIYRDGVIFGIEVEGVLYFKTGRSNQRDYRQARMAPYAYVAKDGRKTEMPYWQVPPRVLENREELCAWARRAIAASIQGSIPATKHRPGGKIG